MNQLSFHADAIKTLCQTHQVSILYAFGSVLTEAFWEDSDVDMAVDFKPMATEGYADNYFNLKYALQDILNRKIDLLEESAIKNLYFKAALQQQRQLIYG